MIKSLEYLQDPEKHSDEKWVSYLYNTVEKKYNVNNVTSLRQITKHSVMNYVIKTLQILDEINCEQPIPEDILYWCEETLKWSEVSKTGSKKDRAEWKAKGYDLYCHNIGSYQIYSEDNSDEIVSVLIKTHGLIGQYVKGEITLESNKELYDLLVTNKIAYEKLRETLIILNRCIVEALSTQLYESVAVKLQETIDRVLAGEFDEKENIIERFRKLNKSLKPDDEIYIEGLSSEVKELLKNIFGQMELWYFDSACFDFTIEEQIKILLLSYKSAKSYAKHISFEKLMHSLYLDYKNKKEVNIYKKRIIETYLKEVGMQDIVENNITLNPHIKYTVHIVNQVIIFNFSFSKQARKLIEFCEVAGTSNSLYQKATFMLYDLFGFRRDAYDRFYNEIDYLNTMNSSLKQKAIILKYIVGRKVLDVGPGGGALMDLIEKTTPDKDIYGIDLSQNVVEKLYQKKVAESHAWNIVKGDALHLSDYFKDMDTIIYSSIIHELYSYIEYNGKKFNKETIAAALKEAYKALKPHGRIIIRDGIMTSPKDMYRLIEFKNPQDIEILNRYCNDFEGRKVTYEVIDKNIVKMLVNDAMEFLYTYTWGEQSYALEVKEQFGYFTLEEYVDFIKQNLPGAKIIESKAFLQEGYEENLLSKISIYDEYHKVTSLPDSTSILVIEKCE